MNLIHFSKKEIKNLRSRHQKTSATGIGKPSGLWVSDEDDYGWKEWCKDNEFARSRFEYAYQVTLNEDARVLHIQSEHEIDAFTGIYGIGMMKAWGIKDAYGIKDVLDRRDGLGFIDWKRVKKRYQGIIISPYQYTRRLHPQTHWYYGWDCASGCIWNKKAIKSIEVVNETVLTN